MSTEAILKGNFAVNWLKEYGNPNNFNSYEHIGVCLDLAKLMQSWPHWKSFFLKLPSIMSTGTLLTCLENEIITAVDNYNVKKLGVYLSGGIDSSILVSVSQRLGIDVLAITGSVLGNNSMEIEKAKIVAKSLNCPHIYYGMVPSDIYLFPQFIQSFSSPVDEVPPFTLWLINKKYALDCDLILCGQNLDTISGSMGYHGKCFLHMLIGNTSTAIDYSYKHKAKLDIPSFGKSPFHEFSINNIRELFLFEYLIGESPRNWISFYKSGFNKPVLFPYAQPNVSKLLLNLPLYQRIFPIRTKTDLYVWKKPFLHKLAKHIGLPGDFRRKSFAHPFSIYGRETYNLMKKYISCRDTTTLTANSPLQINRAFIKLLWDHDSSDSRAETHLDTLLHSIASDINKLQPSGEPIRMVHQRA
ncbi:MAG: hypothetical protein K9K66_11005 [Desulfarculaceae bacterium]|nr:hypothetical protein [Desulfarculaceae bacterium]MCF8118279.1 hypothetical protein [Desulfarculaceae bacterium]